MKRKLLGQLLILSTLFLGQYAFSQRLTRPVLKPIKTVKPLKSALLVLLENGGVVPYDMRSTTIEVPTGKFVCGDHTVRANSTAGLIRAARNYFKTIATDITDPCLNPFRIVQNWTAETREFEIADAINHLTDRVVEETTSAAILPHARSKYDKVFILESATFNPSHAMHILQLYAKTHFFDIHVLAHGGDEVIMGGDSSTGNAVYFEDHNFFEPLEELQQQGLGLEIRSVYQQNCVGFSLSDDWRRLGAKVVSGTPENNYMPLAYGDFLFKWLYQRKNFKDAVEEGFDASEDLYREIYDVVYGMSQADIDERIEGSYPLFLGNTGITHTTRINRVIRRR
jgi:hypothetical protein